MGCVGAVFALITGADGRSAVLQREKKNERTSVK